MNTTHMIQWILVSLALVGMIYAMLVIKNEKFDYLKRAVATNFHGYHLLLPSWWSRSEKSTEENISFERTDTYYDWRANFRLLKDKESFAKPMEILFRDLIEQQNIQFDENEAIIHEPTEFKNIPAITSGDFEVIRVEGMGTEDKEERIYLDAFLLRNNKTQEHIFGQSHSSVLNGMLEGPYFEQVLQNLVKNLS